MVWPGNSPPVSTVSRPLRPAAHGSPLSRKPHDCRKMTSPPVSKAVQPSSPGEHALKLATAGSSRPPPQCGPGGIKLRLPEGPLLGRPAFHVPVDGEESILRARRRPLVPQGADLL